MLALQIRRGGCLLLFFYFRDDKLEGVDACFFYISEMIRLCISCEMPSLISLKTKKKNIKKKHTHQKTKEKTIRVSFTAFVIAALRVIPFLINCTSNVLKHAL